MAAAFNTQTLIQKTRNFTEVKSLGVIGKLLTLGLSAYFISDVTSLLLEKAIPEPPAGQKNITQAFGENRKTIADYNIIFDRNLFNNQGIIPGENASQPISVDNSPAVRTTLPFHLVGTLILKDTSRSIGTIQDKTEDRVYAVQIEDEIPKKARIIDIYSNRVEFINLQNNRKEYIDIPQDNTAPIVRAPSPAQNAGESVKEVSKNRFVLDSKEISKIKPNMSKILTEARAIPVFENGKPAGFRVIQIVPGSIFEKLGLQNNDVITGVNGEPIDAGKAFQLFSELDSLKYVELNVKRGGAVQTFSYDFE